MDHSNVPPPEDLRWLLEQAERLYAMGGPSTREGFGAWDSDDWHGCVLAELDDVANMDPHAFAAVAQRWGLDNAAGLRTLIRLSAACAVAAALRFTLGESVPGTQQPTTPRMVLDEITSSQWWLDYGRDA